MTTDNTEQPTQHDAPNQETSAFTPDDLIQTVMLIDEACADGAFKGWDQIQRAFTIRNRVLQFAQSWKQTIDELEPADGAAPDVETTEVN